jgi:glutaredoxin
MTAAARRLSGETVFRLVLALVLVAAFVALAARERADHPPATASSRIEALAPGVIHVFFHPDCPHCHEALRFLDGRPDIPHSRHDISDPAKERLILDTAARLGIADADLGVPLFVAGNRHVIGFADAATSGPELEALLAPAPPGPLALAATIDLPVLGTVDPAGFSAPVLAIVMGLADGFNPCAMWVLVYLISLIAGMQDRTRIWWLVGTFVLASGILYFLFMTAWLNAFLVLGHVRLLTLAIALAAIGFGIDQAVTLARDRGAVTCEVVSDAGRQATMARLRAVVAAPVGLAGLALMVGLAFTVNAIEFACSAALPAIFTHTLTLMELGPWQRYGAIALYVLAFMLDDLVIFGLAALAVERALGTRYAAFSRGIGAMLLIGLGLWMLMRGVSPPGTV